MPTDAGPFFWCLYKTDFVANVQVSHPPLVFPAVIVNEHVTFQTIRTDDVLSKN